MRNVSGWEFQVTIGGANVAMACKTYRSERRTPSQDMTNSEGEPGNPAAANQAARGFQSVLGAPRRARVVLGSATINVDKNPFIAPLNLKEGDYVTNLKIWPAGTTNPASVETYGSLKVVGITRNGDTQGLQPFEIEFESDGEYT